MVIPGGLFNAFYFMAYEDLIMVFMGIATLHFLYQYKKYVFSAEHYGSGFAAECSTKEEVEYIHSIIPKDFHFDVYDR